MSLKVLKLITGEELIGIVQDGRDVTDTEDGYTHDNLLFITGPLKINCVYDKEARAHSIYLSDWVPAISEDMLPVDKNKILTLGRPTQELEEHYYELVIASQLLQQAEAQQETEQIDDASQDNDNQDLQKKLIKILKSHKFDDDDYQ